MWTVMLGHRLPVFSMLHTPNIDETQENCGTHVYHWWGA